MISSRTLGITHLNETYFLINYSKLDNFKLFINKLEFKYNYNIYSLLYKYYFILKEFEGLLYLLVTMYSAMYHILFRLIHIYLLKNRIFKYYKYNISFYLDKMIYYIYIDRYLYLLFMKHCLNIWFVNKLFIKNLDNNIFNYLSIYIIYMYINSLNAKKMLKLKFRFIVFNSFLNKLINKIFLNIFINIYKKELFKIYLN
jgi:hypothetical protein